MRGFLALLLLVGVAGPSLAADQPHEHFSSAVINPVDLAFASDGRLYAADLATGEIHLIFPDGTSTVVARVPASPGGNGGFTGLAVDPGDPDVLYAQYSMDKPGAPNGKVNRVTRIAAGVETVLVDDIPWAEMHDGGRLAFGPDGALYSTTGDNDLRSPSRDSSSILGKILRIHTDGRPVAGNPAGWHPLVFAKGFRNPFGITVTSDNRVYVSDNGGIEEVNLVRAGQDHGWPACSGPCRANHSEVTDPVAHWGAEHFGPTGIAVLGDTLYLGDFVYGRVRTVNLTSGATGQFTQLGQVLDVAVGPDRCLYISTWKAIVRAPIGDARCGLPDHRAPGAQQREEAPPPEFRIPAPSASALLALAAALTVARRR